MYASPVFAATITVTTSDDEVNNDGDCSFREAVAASETNGSVDTCTGGEPGVSDVIDLVGITGTLPVTGGEMTITEPLTIVGPGDADLALSGDQTSRLFVFSPDNTTDTLRIQDVTLSLFGDAAFEAVEGGTLKIMNGTLVLNGLTVSYSWNGDYGGAIYSSNSTVTIDNTLFDGNYSNNGGAIYIDGGTVDLTNSQFTTNTATNGVVHLNSGTATLTNNTFDGNFGGAAFNTAGIFTLDTVTIQNHTNSYDAYGAGAIINLATGTMIITRSSILNNNFIENLKGSGLYNEGLCTVNNTTFNNNSTAVGGVNSGGGSIYNSGTLSIASSTVSDSTSANLGGGILLAGGSLTISTSSVIGNSAANDGGGIAQIGGSLTLTQSTIASNDAGTTGGGFFVNNALADATIINTTVANNTAPQGGGGLVQDGSTELLNSTFALNVASAGGGSNASNIAQLGGTISLTNDLVSGPVGGLNCFGSVTDNGFNLQYGDSSCMGIPTAVSDPLDSLGLQSNGGFTQTIAILQGSEALDTADSTVCTDANTVNSIDQRGEVRPSGSGCDIGAFELQPAGDTTAPTITNVTSSTSDGTYTADDIILLEVTFDEAVTVTGTPQITLETGTTDAVVDYTSGSGTDTLVFTYTVAAGENSADLDYVATSSLSLNGGTIQDAAANDADLTLLAPAASGSLSSNKALIIDTQAPTLAAVTEVSPDPTTDTTPNFTFSSDEAGTITYGGSCSSATTDASAGNNTITFSTLALGTYADCTITVTDAVGNASDPLAVGEFTIDDCVPGENEQCLGIILNPGNSTFSLEVPGDFSFTNLENSIEEQEVFSSDPNSGYIANLDDVVTVTDTENNGGFTLQLQASVFEDPDSGENIPLTHLYVLTQEASTGGSVFGGSDAGVEYPSGYNGIKNIQAPINNATDGSLTDSNTYLSQGAALDQIVDLMVGPVAALEGGRSGYFKQRVQYYLKVPAEQPAGNYHVTLTFDLIRTAPNG